MAAWRAILPGLLRKILPFGSPANRRWSGVVRLAGAALGGAGALFTASRLLRDVDSRDLLLLRVRAQEAGCCFRPEVTAGDSEGAQVQKEVVIDDGKEKQSLRKQRFMQFASLEFEGEHFMTPRDFLFSVMFEQVERLISYTEYLFLLTILTKPQIAFNIAFRMLDTDGNEQVEKKEFFKLQMIIGTKDELKDPLGNKESLLDSPSDSSDINTTLLVHFFGRKGQDKLHYSQFYRFVENMQTEVQEMEFIQFSKGLDFMRKEDFAEWLLFFTDENNDIYWQNVHSRIPPGESISLEEFKSFYQFMNNLEDFSITVKMFSVANRAVKLAEFKRAVKVATGQELSNNVLDTVFKIFDLDGDNCLSHGEFLGVLKNRLHRGLKHAPQQQGLQGYWKCVKRETLKGANEVLTQTGKSPF
uniref:Mitochondrial calcium uptake 2 n=1 Tax=Leptobrachium leishanense TaxID=445787 RepID=A0A8C5LYK2_9ANUR